MIWPRVPEAQTPGRPVSHGPFSRYWRNRESGSGSGGAGLLLVGVLVLLIGLPFAFWSGAAALILWSYYFALQLVVQRARRAGPMPE